MIAKTKKILWGILASALVGVSITFVVINGYATATGFYNLFAKDGNEYLGAMVTYTSIFGWLVTALTIDATKINVIETNKRFKEEPIRKRRKVSPVVGFIVFVGTTTLYFFGCSFINLSYQGYQFALSCFSVGLVTGGTGSIIAIMELVLLKRINAVRGIALIFSVAGSLLSLAVPAISLLNLFYSGEVHSLEGYGVYSVVFGGIIGLCLLYIAAKLLKLAPKN